MSLKENIRKIMLWSIFLLSIFSCQERSRFQTPNLPVYVELSLQQSRYRDLMTPGGLVILREPRVEGERLGFGGLIVVRDLLKTQFYAFDAACPYENDASVLLEVQDLLVKCPKCKSEFDVVSGSGVPTKEPARHRLRPYTTSYDTNAYRLTISN